MPKYTLTPIQERYWKKVIKGEHGECWRWIGATHEFGYGLLGAGARGTGLIRAHRVSWEIHFGPIPDGMHVLHKCDNPPCSNPDHLFLGDDLANSLDRKSKGRTRNGSEWQHGEAHASSKLTADAVRQIRFLHSCGSIIAELARQFSMGESQISRIIKRESWKQVA